MSNHSSPSKPPTDAHHSTTTTQWSSKTSSITLRNKRSSEQHSFISRAPLLTSRSASSGGQEPVSILGRGRRWSAGAGGGPGISSGVVKHSVKFSEEEFSSSSVGEESSMKLHPGLRYQQRADIALSQSSIPECSQEKEELEEKSSILHQETVLTESRCFSSSATTAGVTATKRTPDKNSLIASMELKVPSILTTPSVSDGGGGGGGLTPVMGSLETRGLTILSPHNPCPEFFTSAFMVRTRKGKTVALPKLRLPGIQAHSHDSIFMG